MIRFRHFYFRHFSFSIFFLSTFFQPFEKTTIVISGCFIIKIQWWMTLDYFHIFHFYVFQMIACFVTLDWIEFNFEPIIQNSTIRKRIPMSICIAHDMQLFSSAFKEVKQYSLWLFREIGFFFHRIEYFYSIDCSLMEKAYFIRINCQKLVLLGMHRTVHVRVLELSNVLTSVEYRGVTISDRRKSECRWNYTLFDSSYHQSHRLHIKHLLKYPSIRENER